jgi:cytochrome P450
MKKLERDGLELTPFAEDFKEDPHAVLKPIRQQCPVQRDEGLGRTFVFDFDDVKEALVASGRSNTTDPRAAAPGTFSANVMLPEKEAQRDNLPFWLNDGERHARFRFLMSTGLNRKIINMAELRVIEIIDELLENIDTDEFDLIGEFAGKLPGLIIAELLGVDRTDQDQFRAWAQDIADGYFDVTGDAEKVARGQEAAAKVDAYLKKVIRDRKANPKDDLISSFHEIEYQGERYNEKDILSLCTLMLTAGNSTTVDGLGNCVKNLLEHPEQLQILKDDQSLIDLAIEELIRFDAPTININRVALQDMEIQSSKVAKGDSLSLCVATANRDPKQFPNPDKLDIQRGKIRHHGWGGGLHFCPGAILARVELRHAILGLFKKFPDLELSAKGHEYQPVPQFRGLRHLWVKT